MFAAIVAALVLHTGPPHFIHEYVLPLGAYPLSIVSGPDGALWFNTYPYYTNHPPRDMGIGRITTTGKKTFYHINHGTYDLTVGADNRIWFTSPYKKPWLVGAITMTGTISTWPVASDGLPESIVSGPDNNLWYVAFGGNPDIIRMNTSGSVVATYKSISGYATRLGSDPDGFVWYDSPARVGRISMTGNVKEQSIGGPTYIPDFMAFGPDRRMWECDGTYIVALADNMSPTFYQIPPQVNGTYGLTRGPDGNLWATDFDQGALLRITPAGTITVYQIPTPNMVPSGITVGPDGNIWFTEIQKQTDVSAIGVLAP
jgi:virginiamycin B lyase